MLIYNRRTRLMLFMRGRKTTTTTTTNITNTTTRNGRWMVWWVEVLRGKRRGSVDEDMKSMGIKESIAQDCSHLLSHLLSQAVKWVPAGGYGQAGREPGRAPRGDTAGRPREPGWPARPPGPGAAFPGGTISDSCC